MIAIELIFVINNLLNKELQRNKHKTTKSK